MLPRYFNPIASPTVCPQTPPVQSRPVYITLPTDLVNAVVSATPLETPLDFTTPENDAAIEAVVLAEIMKHIAAAQERVSVIVDGCALRHGVTREVKDFLEKTKFPVFATPMGKSGVDESSERFGGVRSAPRRFRVPLTHFREQIYIGKPSLPAVKQTIERAVLIISIGAIYSDLNTGGFSHDLPKTKLVEVELITYHEPSPLLIPFCSCIPTGLRFSRPCTRELG